MKAEDKNATQPIRVKVEIATRERIATRRALRQVRGKEPVVHRHRRHRDLH